MTTDLPHPVAEPVWGRRARCVILGLLVVVMAVRFSLYGVPIDLPQVYAWVAILLVAGCVGRSRQWVANAALQWIPFITLIVAYQFGYGLAGRFHKDTDLPVEGDTNVLGIGLHVRWPVDVDRALFGGVLPTQWVQEHAHPGGGVPWFAWIVTLVYCSHFVLAPLAAIVLWWRRSPLFRPWLCGVLALAAGGLTTYFLFPMAPPWLASEQGVIDEPVQRLIGEGWSQLHFTTARTMLETGNAMSNPVAAMPSLHLATSLLAAVVLPWRCRAVVRGLALLYPAAMAFTLVYGGEHYVVDEMAGATLASAIVVAWRAIAARHRSVRS